MSDTPLGNLEPLILKVNPADPACESSKLTQEEQGNVDRIIEILMPGARAEMGIVSPIMEALNRVPLDSPNYERALDSIISFCEKRKTEIRDASHKAAGRELDGRL